MCPIKTGKIEVVVDKEVTYHQKMVNGQIVHYATEGPIVDPSNPIWKSYYHEWRLDRVGRHRLDGPAVVSGQCEVWYQYNKMHRDDGPAYTLLYTKDGRDDRWYRNGKLHRLDGPAYVSFLEIPKFYVNGIVCILPDDYTRAVARWRSYKEVTREEICSLIGNFRIVEW